MSDRKSPEEEFATEAPLPRIVGIVMDPLTGKGRIFSRFLLESAVPIYICFLGEHYRVIGWDVRSGGYKVEKEEVPHHGKEVPNPQCEH